MKITEISRKKFAPATETQKLEVQEKIKKLRKQYEKMRKGTFYFDDAQGGWFEFNFRYFPGDGVQTVKIAHGEVIEIPELLMVHINNTKRKVRMPMDTYLKGSYRQGEITNLPTTKISRISFVPLDASEVPCYLAV